MHPYAHVSDPGRLAVARIPPRPSTCPSWEGNSMLGPAATPRVALNQAEAHRQRKLGNNGRQAEERELSGAHEKASEHHGHKPAEAEGRSTRILDYPDSGSWTRLAISTLTTEHRPRKDQQLRDQAPAQQHARLQFSINSRDLDRSFGGTHPGPTARLGRFGRACYVADIRRKPRPASRVEKGVCALIVFKHPSESVVLQPGLLWT